MISKLTKKLNTPETNDTSVSKPNELPKEKTLIYDYSLQGKSACRLPNDFLPQINFNKLEENGLLRTEKPRLPEVSEIEIVRHYTKLSKLNYGIDDGFYPLGSCTMKYNPKINEDVASIDGFKNGHPHQDESDCQGTLALLYDLEKSLCKIFGFSAFSLQPSAGAQGEYVGLLIMKAYHKNNNNLNKNIILIPDSAHGTNPASVTGVGWKAVNVKTIDGQMDINDLKLKLTDDVAGLMITNPNTLGVYDKNIATITKLIHSVDGLVYWDGANANAIMGYASPAVSGFDICHLNLHKTFSTPHGGGGPGAGPVGVVKHLIKYLPAPRVIRDKNVYRYDKGTKDSVGRVHGFFGNIGILVRAYTYIRSLGSEGLKEVSENTVLLANYMKKKLEPHYDIATPSPCKHEFIISLKKEKKEYGVRALDVAKRLMDYGFHPPTIYFPQIVSEALMIETPESEPVAEIDNFIEAMIKIKKEIVSEPKLLHEAPINAPYRRFDEARAVKQPKLTYFWS